jgi:hypothetical protein
VVVDRLRADEEQVGDLRVRLALDDELEDLALAVKRSADRSGRSSVSARLAALEQNSVPSLSLL